MQMSAKYPHLLPSYWPLVEQTQAWFFKLHSKLTGSALLCCYLFMLTNHSLESTEPTIQYTVRVSPSHLWFSMEYSFNILFHCLISVFVLNPREDECQKLENWIPIGWMPISDESKSKRPTQVMNVMVWGRHACDFRKFEYLGFWNKQTQISS